MEEILTLPSLRQLIDEANLKTKKKFGQNFLLDANITDKIARVAGPLNDRTVIEVGPGPGGLTRSLLLAGADRIIAIEKDPDCVSLLYSLVQAAKGKLTLRHQDALTLDYQALLAPQTKIIANLPYNVGTPLLLKWLPLASSIESMTLMFQKEVALRLCAQPNSKNYGRLSVITQFYTSSRILFDVPAQAFTPSPKVTSSIVQLNPHKHLPFTACPKALEHLLKVTFGQRRKMLRSSLKNFVDNAERLLENANIPPVARPEELSLEDFCRLATLYKEHHHP